jgi:hypothetical protein
MSKKLADLKHPDALSLTNIETETIRILRGTMKVLYDILIVSDTKIMTSIGDLIRKTA